MDTKNLLGEIAAKLLSGRIEVVDLNEGYGIRPLYRIPRDAFLASRGLKHLIPATGKKDGAA